MLKLFNKKLIIITIKAVIMEDQRHNYFFKLQINNKGLTIIIYGYPF